MNGQKRGTTFEAIMQAQMWFDAIGQDVTPRFTDIEFVVGLPDESRLTNSKGVKPIGRKAANAKARESDKARDEALRIERDMKRDEADKARDEACA
ncbi:unnamed protein product [Prunus armeniaca]